VPRIHKDNFAEEACYHVRDADWGTMYTAYRPAQPGHHYHRVTHRKLPGLRFAHPEWLRF
jgi:hypothetical protein